MKLPETNLKRQIRDDLVAELDHRQRVDVLAAGDRLRDAWNQGHGDRSNVRLGSINHTVRVLH